MPSHDVGTDGRARAVPSMLDLIRLSPRRLLPPGGPDLYRQIALLTEMTEGHEVLGVACGKGTSIEYFTREHGVVASGVDIDPANIEAAEEWSRGAGLGDRLQFQTGRSDALPYRDHVFDITLGEVGLANHCDPADAVSELVRVTKPGGHVVLVQLVWKAPVDPERQRVLSEHLGVRPLMLVEWKRLLRAAGVEGVHTEDWSDEETAFRRGVVKPFPDFAEVFTLPEKVDILRRAWRQWGWKGVRSVLERESEVHRLLTAERILGLDLLKGRKRVTEDAGSEQRVGPRARSKLHRPSDEPTPVAQGAPAREHPGEPRETAGLPLFGERGEGSPE
jgi:SAM-dependent methyltransferase